MFFQFYQNVCLLLSLYWHTSLIFYKVVQRQIYGVVECIIIIIIIMLLQIVRRVCQRKNFENQLLNGENMDKSKVSRFHWPILYIYCRNPANSSHFIPFQPTLAAARPSMIFLMNSPWSSRPADEDMPLMLTPRPSDSSSPTAILSSINSNCRPLSIELSFSSVFVTARGAQHECKKRSSKVR